MDSTDSDEEDEDPWLDIMPDYTFVTTLESDLLHIRRPGGGGTMLCGRAIPAEYYADYPAKAMRFSELCPICLQVYAAAQ